MSKQNYYVVTRSQGGWTIKRIGSSKASAVTDTQLGAIQIGRDLTKKKQGELFIQGTNRKFREKNSYSNYSYPPKVKHYGSFY